MEKYKSSLNKLNYEEIKRFNAIKCVKVYIRRNLGFMLQEVKK